MKVYYSEILMMIGLLSLSIMSLLVSHQPVYLAGAGLSMKEAFVIQFIFPAAVLGDALFLGYKNKYNLAFSLEYGFKDLVGRTNQDLPNE